MAQESGKADKNIHEGHRKRMRERFEQNGPQALGEHEVLEMLLYYAYPQVDTNEIAHRLISRFGSLAGVFDAPAETLVKLGKISYNAAIMMKLMPAAMRHYYVSRAGHISFDTAAKLKALFSVDFAGIEEEQFRLVCFDDELKIISDKVMGKGANISAAHNVHRMLEELFAAESMYAAIAHNHPGRPALPSNGDIFSTRRVIDTFRSAGITLVDHVIVGMDGAYSMRDSDTLTIFDR